MKGNILLKILELLADKAISTTDFVGAVLASGYGANMSKIEYEYGKRRRFSALEKEKLLEFMKQKACLQKFLSKLKHDGLIMQTKKEKNRFFLSKKGEVKLAQLKNSLPTVNYETPHFL